MKIRAFLLLELIIAFVGFSCQAASKEVSGRIIMWLAPYADSHEHYVVNIVTLVVENNGIKRIGGQSVLKNNECMDIRQYAGRGSGELILSGIRCSWEKMSGLVVVGNNRIWYEKNGGSADINLLLKAGEKGFDLDLVYRRRGGLGSKNLEIQMNTSRSFTEVVPLGEWNTSYEWDESSGFSPMKTPIKNE